MTRDFAITRAAACRSSVALLVLCTACVSPPPELRYQPPAAGAPAAEIVDAGLSGSLATVDGKETRPQQHTLIAPGVHHVAVNCLFRIGELKYFSNKIEHAVLTGNFQADQKYYVRCTVEEGKPHAFLAATPNGPPLADFE